MSLDPANLRERTAMSAPADPTRDGPAPLTRESRGGVSTRLYRFHAVKAPLPLSQQSTMEAVLSVAVGIGLAAACGMRVFLPLLAMSVATHLGLLNPGGATGAWLGTWPSLLALSTAASVEVVAYYIPWLDNVLDSIATPLATVAGALAAAAVMLPPETHAALASTIAGAGDGSAGSASGWQWAASLVSGGATAGLVQVSSVVTRAASTVGTGGAGNPVVATAENAGAATLSITMIIAPLIGLTLLLLAVFLGYRWFFRGRRLSLWPFGRRAGAAAFAQAATPVMRRSWLRPWRRVPA